MEADKDDFGDASFGSSRLRLTVFSFGFLVSVTSAWHNLMMPFLAPSLDHWCVTPPQDMSTSGNTSGTQEDESPSLLGQCVVYNASANSTDSPITCQSWEYDTSLFGDTLVNKWDLVCERKWLISFSQSVFMGGYITSMLIFGQLSDRFGRRPTMCLSLVVFTVSGFLCLASRDYVTFTALRFFVSMGVTGAGTTSFILLMEIAGTRNRSRYGIGFQFGWATGYVILPALAWLIKDWFYLQLTTILPSFLLIIMWWYIPESPRWLLINGHEDEARKMFLGKDESRHRDAFPRIQLWMNKEREMQRRKKRTMVADLFRTHHMRKKTFILFFCWFVNSFIYFALSLNTTDLGGNPYLNFFLAGVIEFPACITAIFLIRYLGRRIPQMTTMLLGGVACLLIVPLLDGSLVMRVALALLGKFCITASFAILYVFSAELYPTIVRTVGVGASSTCARAASMLSPFVKDLSDATHPSVPFVVFGGTAIIGGLCVLLLPETKNRSLPDTVQDGEIN